MSSILDNMWISQLRDWISSPLGIVALSCLLGYVAYVHSRREHPTYDDEDYEKEGHVKLPAPLKDLKLTREELKTYDSQNPNGRYLVGFLDKLYDVSCCPQDFGPNGSYEELTGTDIMWYVQKTVRYEPRGFDAYVEECEKRLEDRFFVAGVLLDDVKERREKDEMEKVKLTSAADSGSTNSSDSGWDTVNDSSTDADFDENELDDERDEKAENIEDVEETLIWTKADETLLAQ